MTPQCAPPLVVRGGSTGAVHAVKTARTGLSASLPAAVLVVIHRSDGFPGHLTHILQAASALPVAFAVHGESIEPGRVYVAPPDSHLRVRGERLEVVRGHCRGSMTEDASGGNLEFSCHGGHRFSSRGSYAEQTNAIESALWAAVLALEEGTSATKRWGTGRPARSKSASWSGNEA